MLMSNECRRKLINLLPAKENWYWKEDGSIQEHSRIMSMVDGKSYKVKNIFAFGMSSTTVYLLSDVGNWDGKTDVTINPEMWTDYVMFSKDKIVSITLPNCFPIRGPQKKM